MFSRMTGSAATLLCGALLSATLIGCTTQRETPAGTFRWRSSSIDTYPGGQFHKGKLAEPAEVRGYPAQRWVHFHDNGQLRGLQLAQAWTVSKHELPADTFLWFDASGRLETVWLSEDTAIEGLPCRGGGKVSTSFHPDGSLRACFLAEDSPVNGIPCSASIWVPVRFYEEGTLAECEISEAITIDGVTFPPGSHLAFDRDGHASLVE